MKVFNTLQSPCVVLPQGLEKHREVTNNYVHSKKQKDYYDRDLEDRLYALIFVTKTDSFSSRRPEFEEIAANFKFEQKYGPIRNAIRY